VEGGPLTARVAARFLRLKEEADVEADDDAALGVEADVEADAKRTPQVVSLGPGRMSWSWFLTDDLHVVWFIGQLRRDSQGAFQHPLYIQKEYFLLVVRYCWMWYGRSESLCNPTRCEGWNPKDRSALEKA